MIKLININRSTMTYTLTMPVSYAVPWTVENQVQKQIMYPVLNQLWQMKSQIRIDMIRSDMKL